MTTQQSAEVSESLSDFAESIRTWTRKINLVAPSTVSSLWERHILDCLQISDLVPEKGLTWCDLGSGAGLPGLVSAIARKDHMPRDKHILIEADHRKAAFLKMQSSRFGIDVDIVTDRIETAPRAQADIVTARALAPLDRLIALALPHSKNDARMIFMKGADFSLELEGAMRKFEFDCEVVQSKYSEGKILVLRNARQLEIVR